MELSELVGDVVLEYEAKERETIIRDLVNEYIVYCKQHGIINGEELLLLVTFINDYYSGETSNTYILTDSDYWLHQRQKNKRETKAVDLRIIVYKMRAYKHTFDWNKLESYI